MNRCLMLISVALLAVCLSGSAATAQKPDSADRAPLLVTPAWLTKHLQDANLVLLHLGEKSEFEKEHIPGAQFITLQDISTPRDPSGKGLTLELPPVEQLQAAFESRGISNDSRVVVYFGKDWVSPATRVIWTLAYLGLGDHTSLLDGGMPAWRAAGGALTSDRKTPAAGHLTPQLHPEIVVDAAWVASHLHQPSVVLIDARMAHSFSGQEENRMPRAGHIPGAQNIPIENVVDDRGQLKEQSTLADMFRAAGAKSGTQVVSYCYIGQRATLIWFVARLLGYEARMYDGSWEDWSRRTDLPVETGTVPARKE